MITLLAGNSKSALIAMIVVMFVMIMSKRKELPVPVSTVLVTVLLMTHQPVLTLWPLTTHRHRLYMEDKAEHQLIYGKPKKAGSYVRVGA